MKTKDYLRFLSSLSILIVITILPSLPAIAAETAEYKVVPCNVVAPVISDDPAGVSVRSGPGAQYPVIGTLPTGPGVVVSPTITGSAGEWLRIEDIWVGEWPEGAIHPRFPDSGPLKLTGWVSGLVLGVRTEGPEEYDSSPPSAVVPLYEEPATSSPVLTRVRSDIDVSVVGCRGEWVKVRYRGVEGWLAPLNQAGEDSEG